MMRLFSSLPPDHSRIAKAQKSRFLGIQSMAPRSCALALLFLGPVGCAIHDGSGELETETRTLQAASKLEVCCGFDVNLILASDVDPTVKITTDDNLLDEVAVKVKNGRVQIGWATPGAIYHPTDSVQIDLILPALERFEGSGGTRLVSGDVSGESLSLALSGGSTADFEELRAEDFELEESGGSQVAIELLVSESVKVASSGGSRLQAQGVATALEMDISGGGKLVAADLICETADLDLSGGSQVSLTVLDELVGNASGGSSISLSGDADVRVSLSGDSEVRRN